MSLKVDKMSLDKMSLDKIALDKISACVTTKDQVFSIVGFLVDTF